MPKDQAKHYNGNFAVKAIIKEKNQLLVCRGVGDVVWELPGGRLHADESPQAGLAREIREEIGLEIEVGPPIHICRSYHQGGKVWQIIAGFSCTISGSGKLHVDREELEECKWVSIKELTTLPMFDDCREIVDVWLALPYKQDLGDKR